MIPASQSGLRIKIKMFTPSSRSECVRLKNFVTGAIIQNNTIEGCGIWDYRFGNEGKNGEGIYTGTSSKQVNLKSLSVPSDTLIHLVRALSLTTPISKIG